MSRKVNSIGYNNLAIAKRLKEVLLLMRKDDISAILNIGFGLFYLIYSLKYNAGSIDNPQLGFFPRIIGIVMVFFSLMFLLFCIRKRGQKDKLHVIWEGLNVKNILSATIVIGSLSLYLIILNYVGFLLASSVLVFFLAWAMGGNSWIVNIILGRVSSGLIYWIFWTIMRVPIPLGSLWGK